MSPFFVFKGIFIKRSFRTKVVFIPKYEFVIFQMNLPGCDTPLYHFPVFSSTKPTIMNHLGYLINLILFHSNSISKYLKWFSTFRDLILNNPTKNQSFK